MKYVLFATAGHVDHGKTSLIKALTGIDTDRLPEEKKRGLSIDLGFAYVDFPEINTRLELIDIPGHERFIKNAIAGLTSVSGILLVVDANEGVMPQTVEHFRVAKSLGINRGIAVLTKIDKTDREILEIAEEELRNFLKKENCDIPIVRISALTGEGLEELKESLKEIAGQIREEREEVPLRVLVDSAFVVKGHGTVLRGSCVEGKIREGDRVIVEPIGIVSRARRIQNHGEFVKEAVAGERVALNLPDVDSGLIERGFWVLKPRTYEKSRILIIRSEADLKAGRLYYVFFGMREVRGRVRHVEEDIYTLRLEEEVVARRRDRLIILNSSGEFAGGAEVLHPKARITKKHFIKENAGYLFENFELYLLKEMGADGFSGDYFRRLTGKAPNTAILEREGIKVGGKFYSKDYVETTKDKIKEYLAKELEKGAYGVEKESVKEKFSIEDELLEYLIASLKTYRIMNEFIVDEGRSDLSKNPEFNRLMEVLTDGIKEEREILSEGISKEILGLAVKRRYIHRIGDYLIISEELLKKYVDELKDLGDSFDVQSAKKALGLTRKYLIPLLEYLDFLGYTVREGNRRRWRR